MAVYVLILLAVSVYVIFRLLNRNECQDSCTLEVKDEEPFGAERGDRQDR